MVVRTERKKTVNDKVDVSQSERELRLIRKGKVSFNYSERLTLFLSGVN